MRRKRRRSTSARKHRAPGVLSALEQERISCALSAWTGVVGRCQWCDAVIEAPRRRTWCSNTCARVWQRNHIWRFARAAAKRRAKYYCQRDGCDAQRRDCEVNHRAARNGGGYGPGCHHHLDADQHGEGGLEVLCRAHHREVTTAQAKARAAQRRAARTNEAVATDPG